MPIFQLALIANIAGLLVADWFCTAVLEFPDDNRLIIWMLGIISSQSITIVFLYQSFASQPLSSIPVTPKLSELFSTIVPVIPLVIAVIFVIAPLISRNYFRSWVILCGGLALWCVIKLVLRRR